jgi:hypothetical protein
MRAVHDAGTVVVLDEMPVAVEFVGAGRGAGAEDAAEVFLEGAAVHRAAEDGTEGPGEEGAA